MPNKHKERRNVLKTFGGALLFGGGFNFCLGLSEGQYRTGKVRAYDNLKEIRVARTIKEDLAAIRKEQALLQAHPQTSGTDIPRTEYLGALEKRESEIISEYRAATNTPVHRAFQKSKLEKMDHTKRSTIQMILGAFGIGAGYMLTLASDSTEKEKPAPGGEKDEL